MAKAILKGWQVFFGKLLLTALLKGANKTDMDYVKNIANIFIPNGKDALEAIGDKDPNDKEQLRQIVDNIIQKTDFSQLTKEQIQLQIDNLQSDNLKKTAIIVCKRLFPILTVFFDDNPDNESQLEEIVKDFTYGGDMEEIVMIWLELDDNDLDKGTKDRVRGKCIHRIKEREL